MHPPQETKQVDWASRYWQAAYRLGFCAPIVLACCSVATATRFGPVGWRYSLLHNAISDLGNAALSPWHWVFNASLLLCSVLLTFFVLGVGALIGSRIGKAIGIAGVAANLGMALVAIFPSNPATMKEHAVAAAVAFGGIFLLSAAFVAFVLLKRREGWPAWLAIPSLLNLGFILAFIVRVRTDGPGAMLPGAGIFVGRPCPPLVWLPALEWAAMLTVMLWCFAAAYAMRMELRQRPAGQQNA